MIDAFSADVAGAVLVAQVQVGGVGLNIQAASVVVLCEPQLTPAAEDQAIARVHRMGQVRTVRVHRLLEPGGVDERIRALLVGKRRAFDEFVRESAVADRALHAVDVSRTDLARRVVAQEQARLGYGAVWDELEADEAPTTGPTTPADDP
jgi:superfamily II DNA or RNA helicase